MLPKQRVASSSLVSRSTSHTQSSCELFTKSLLCSFLESRASGTSPKTIVVYHLALDRFIGYPLTPEGINAYLNSLTCGNAKHNYYRCIKTLCRWLYYTDQIPTNPIEKVLPPRRQKKLLPAITKEQLDTLLSYCQSERDRVIVNLLWYSGLRLSEAATVKSVDFDWQEGTVVILGKGNRYRKAIAGNGIVRKWFQYHQSLEVTADGIKTMLKRLCKTTGIHCNPHSFRRGFCVYNVKLGLSNKVIQVLGGWETPDMVSHYAQSLTFEEALYLYNSMNQHA
ncbi:tyrosine-type recombinase/integrase [Chloroflexota bacterium]